MILDPIFFLMISLTYLISMGLDTSYDLYFFNIIELVNPFAIYWDLVGFGCVGLTRYAPFLTYERLWLMLNARTLLVV
jgi:hypothetical protein